MQEGWKEQQIKNIYIFIYLHYILYSNTLQRFTSCISTIASLQTQLYRQLKIYLYKNIISDIRLQTQMYDKTFKWQNIFKSL